MSSGYFKVRYATAVIVVLALALVVSGCSGGSAAGDKTGDSSAPGSAPQAAVHGTISVGTAVTETRMGITSAGGTVTVNNQSSPINGLTITVPQGAYSSPVTFTVSDAPVTGHTFGKNFNPASPLITVDNGGSYANDYVSLKIPVNASPDDFVMAFIYDKVNQSLEGLYTVDRDSSSITVETLHFCDIEVVKIKQSELDAINTVDTGFLPGRDDFEFSNNGSIIEPGGHCAGQSVTMMWYYTEKRQKENAHVLYGLYDDNGREKTTQIYGDDVLAYRLASMVQSSIQFDYYNQKFGNTIRNESALTNFNSFKYSMLLTGEPQYVRLRNNNGGHAIVCYAVQGNTLCVADPNYPGKARTISLAGGTLGPYSTGANSEDIATNGATAYTKIYYAGKTSMIPVYALPGLWNQFKAGTIGDDKFPDEKVALNFTNEKGAQKTEFVFGGKNAETRKITTNLSYVALQMDNPYTTPDMIKKYQNNQILPGGKVPLQPGKNLIGLEFFRDINGKNKWAGFIWLEIYCQPDEATPTPTTKPTSTPTPTPLPGGDRKPPVRVPQTVTLASVSNPLLPYSETLWDGGTLTGTYYKDANSAVVRHGTFTTKDKNGQLKQEETYSKGKIIGYFRKYTSGKLVSEAFDGDNGLVQYEDYYNANGKPSLQRDFWEDGITKKSEYNFNDDGSLSSYYEYDHSGKNTIEEHYEKGKLVSSTKH
ncbi:MAG TPA: hypothetical protein VGJ92_01245 [Methanocella sp.]|jgi:hypothetical protein